MALSNAYRTWARAHPGRYAASVHWPEPGDTEHLASSYAVVQIALAALANWKLSGDDAIDAIRAVRATLHGFISLEQANGFGRSMLIAASIG